MAKGQPNMRFIANPPYADATKPLPGGFRPILFTVTQIGSNIPMYDVALALHVNPSSIDFRYTKSKNVTPTYGGFVEYIWPDDLDAISAEQSTGTFLHPKQGLVSTQSGNNVDGSHKTMAHERFQDFVELFKNNGMVFDSTGKPTLRGRVVMIMDRGIFFGHFSSFNVTEDATTPFVFSLSWEFKAEQSFYFYGTE